MIDFIICKIEDGYYAFNLDNVQRIVESKELTNISDGSIYIDGIMTYENRAIEIINLRRVLNFKEYENEMRELFEKLIQQHNEWIDALEDSIKTGVSFTLTTNSHLCNLGKWLDKFVSYDFDIKKILDEIKINHINLHNSAINLLKISKVDTDKALDVFNKTTVMFRDKILILMNKLLDENSTIATSMKKILIYKFDKKTVGLIVDAIENIVHLNESEVEFMETGTRENNLIDVSRVVEIDSKLISIVANINIDTIKNKK